MPEEVVVPPLEVLGKYLVRPTWRAAALRVGEAMAFDGPDGYNAFTPEEWQEWALQALIELKRNFAEAGARAALKEKG